MQAVERREDLKRRLDSKSALGEYMGLVVDVAGYLAVNAGMVQCLLQFLGQAAEYGNAHAHAHADAAPCSELLVVLAKFTPQVCYCYL